MKVIDSIGVIGGTHGLGASLAAYLRDKFLEKKVCVSGRKTDITNNKIVQECDLVLFAVPLSVTNDVIASLCKDSRSDQIWMDVTSIKVTPVENMLKSKAEVCGAHPMFAPTLKLRGQKMILCPARISEDSLERLKSLFDDLDLIETTPEDHDRIMGVVQGLSHFSDFALGATLAKLGWKKSKILEFSSAPYHLKFEVMGRMFYQNPELYAHISNDNPFCREVIQSFSQTVDQLKDADTDSWIEQFEQVQDYLGASTCQKAYHHSQKAIEALYLNNDKLVSDKVISCEGAIFGGQNSHTDEASSLFAVRKKAEVAYFGSIFEVFEAVQTGQAAWGIVPYENSNQGSIVQTLDELFEREDIHIIEAQEKAIVQNLVGLSGTNLSDIQKIYSHPQAFSQSKAWVREYLPQADFDIKSSTAKSAQEVICEGKKSIAAIASQSVAERLGLEILAPNIEAKENKTRFVLIEKSPVPESGERLSLAFWFRADQAGNLARVLTFFSEKNINLTKLDSLRADQKHGSYVFFIDVEISLQDFEVLRSGFEKLVGGWKVLGSF